MRFALHSDWTQVLHCTVARNCIRTCKASWVAIQKNDELTDDRDDEMSSVTNHLPMSCLLMAYLVCGQIARHLRIMAKFLMWIYSQHLRELFAPKVKTLAEMMVVSHRDVDL